MLSLENSSIGYANKYKNTSVMWCVSAAHKLTSATAYLSYYGYVVFQHINLL